MPKPIKSIEEKQAAGTLRSDRVPKNLIKPLKLDRIPKTPDYFLNKTQKILWKKYCNYLLSENRLNDTDLPLVELIINEWTLYYVANEKIEDLKETEGIVLKQYNQGGQEYETISSWVKIRTTCLEKIQKLSSEMGMTPAARNRVGIIPVGGNENDGVRGLRNSIMSLHAGTNGSKSA